MSHVIKGLVGHIDAKCPMISAIRHISPRIIELISTEVHPHNGPQAHTGELISKSATNLQTLWQLVGIQQSHNIETPMDKQINNSKGEIVCKSFYGSENDPLRKADIWWANPKGLVTNGILMHGKS